MATYDLDSPSGQQEFQNWVNRTIQNEINSYARQVLGISNTGVGNASATSSSGTGSAGNIVIPSGVIVPYAGGPGISGSTKTDLPEGWLLCNGTAISRVAYSNLWNAIGTTYGSGDGSTTFNVPNLLGRIPVGAGTGAQQGVAGTGIITGGTALTTRTMGQFFGDERLQSHTHTATWSGTTSGHSNDHIHGFNPRSAGGWNSGATQLIINAGTQYWGLRSTNNNGDGGTTGPTYGVSADHTHTYSGSNNTGDHNQSIGVQQNLQPSLVTNYIIKT